MHIIIITALKKIYIYIYIYKMSEFFSKPYKFSCIYVKIDLSNYITKDDVKNVTGADTSNVAEK